MNHGKNTSRSSIFDLAKSIKQGSTKQPSSSKMKLLSYDFVPGPYDVICSRKKTALRHKGNIRYQKIIDENVQRYAKSKTKIEKSLVISSMVELIREASPHGGFVKQKGGRWYEVGDMAAREKVSHSFRNALHTVYRSSTEAKKRRREALKRIEFEKQRIQSTCSQNTPGIKQQDEFFSTSSHILTDEEDPTDEVNSESTICHTNEHSESTMGHTNELANPLDSPVIQSLYNEWKNEEDVIYPMPAIIEETQNVTDEWELNGRDEFDPEQLFWLEKLVE